MHKVFEHEILQINFDDKMDLSELGLFKRKTSLCNSLEVWRQIFNFSNQISAQSESQYLPYNQQKSTFLLIFLDFLLFYCRRFFGIYCHHNLTYFYNKVSITEKHRL